MTATAPKSFVVRMVAPYAVLVRLDCHAMMSDCFQRTDPVPRDTGRGNFPVLIKR